MNELTLLDWKRRVFALYVEIRDDPEPERAWRLWREIRHQLFRAHPQSPSRDARPTYFDYDPALRAHGSVEPVERVQREIATSGDEPYSFTRFARARFDLRGEEQTLDLYWLDGYDFNFSYNPSCAYDAKWVCPLAPPGNRLAVPITGGERAPAP